jgi:1-acyl-sn-glycerol-3-phosphate acyltransferase
MRVAMQFTHNTDKLFERTKNNVYSNFTADPLALSYQLCLKKLAHALYQPYKWLIAIPFFAISTLLIFPFALISVLLFGPKICSAVFPPMWARMNSKIAPMRVNTSGKELIEPGQSYVIVSNHQSHYDIFVLYGWLGVDIKWVMKTELRKAPVIGYICKKMEHIFIDRSDHRAAIESINRAKAKIVNGTSVIFFPEGTRSEDGRLGRFKKGAFRLAVDLGLPILPVTISGTHAVLPKGTLDLFPGAVDMIVHPPIQASEYDSGNLEALMEKTRKVIASELPEQPDFTRV